MTLTVEVSEIERRMHILRSHPNSHAFRVTNDPSFVPVVLSIAITHLFISIYIINQHWSLWVIMAAVYGSYVHAQIDAISHDILHKSEYGSKFWYTLLITLITLPTLRANFFRSAGIHKFHHDHLYKDVSINLTRIGYYKRKYSRTWYTRLFWVLFYPYMQAPKSTVPSEIVPVVEEKLKCESRPFWRKCQAMHFTAMLVFAIGLIYSGMWKLCAYWFMCTYFRNHFPMKRILDLEIHAVPTKVQHKQKAISHYSPFANICMFNYSHHCEHHDFHEASSRYYPAIRKLAADYYHGLRYKTSLSSSIWSGLFDEKENYLTTALDVPDRGFFVDD